MKNHPTITWRVTGSDGYLREFHDEDEAREVFAQIPAMRHIDSELHKVTTYAEVIAVKPHSKKVV